MKNIQKFVDIKSKNRILVQLKDKKFESLNILKKVEGIFINLRGYIFIMPKPGTKCIILATGGLDSVIATFILLKFFRIKLYPLFINWGQKNLKQEEKAFDFFTKYFLKKYPKLYNQPKKIKSHIPAKEIFQKRSDVVVLRNTSFANHAVSYAKYLEETKKIKIRTVFLNTVATDGILCPDTTLTAIRTTNLNICVNEADFSWQITSLAIEKEIGFYFNKEDLIPLAIKTGLPLYKTWSCYQSGHLQCGECFTCWGRKNGFKAARVLDKTKYFNNTIAYKVLSKIKYKLQRLNIL